MLAAKLTLFLAAGILVAGGWKLVGILSTDPVVRWPATALLALLALEWSLTVVTPDVIAVAIIVWYLLALDRLRRSESTRDAVVCGLLGALLYLDKAVGLPLFLAHFTLATLRPATVRRWLTKVAAFAVASVPWVAAMTWKYGALTMGTAGTHNWRLMGPETRRFEPFWGALFAPPNPVATSFWENPSAVGDAGLERARRARAFDGSRRTPRVDAARDAVGTVAVGAGRRRGARGARRRVSRSARPAGRRGARHHSRGRARHRGGAAVRRRGALRLDDPPAGGRARGLPHRSNRRGLARRRGGRNGGRRRVARPAVARRDPGPTGDRRRHARYAIAASELPAALRGSRTATNPFSLENSGARWTSWNDGLYLSWHAGLRYFGVVPPRADAATVSRELDRSGIETFVFVGPDPVPRYLAAFVQVASLPTMQARVFHRAP